MKDMKLLESKDHDLYSCLMETSEAKGLEMFVNILGNGCANFLVKKRRIILIWHVDE